METKNWYVASMGSDPHNQGLVADEDTGENIAVTYKAENAPIVSAAPDLAKALKELYRVLREDEGYMPYNPKMMQAREAYEKATGEKLY